MGKEPNINFPDTNYWRIAPGDGGRLWPTWEQLGIASLGQGHLSIDTIRAASKKERDTWDVHSSKDQLYSFIDDIKARDVIVAGSRKPSQVYGIGIVAAGFENTNIEFMAEIYQHNAVLNHERYIQVIWFSIAASGLPITTSANDQIFNSATLKQLSKTQLQQISNTICQKLENKNGGRIYESVATQLQDHCDICTEISPYNFLTAEREQHIPKPGSVFSEVIQSVNEKGFGIIKRGDCYINIGPVTNNSIGARVIVEMALLKSSSLDSFNLIKRIQWSQQDYR